MNVREFGVSELETAELAGINGGETVSEQVKKIIDWLWDALN